jgi:hypothetical protein
MNDCAELQNTASHSEMGCSLDDQYSLCIVTSCDSFSHGPSLEDFG